jgi:hypothetical protein
MKRKFFAVLAIGAVAFVSCKKDEPVAPAEPGMATVQGTLWADLDTWNDTNQSGGYQHHPEYAPAGTKVTIIVDSYDLDPTPDPSFDYQDLKFTTTVGTNGAYSITDVPCYNTPIDAKIYFNDFTADQVWGPLSADKTHTVFTLGWNWVTIYDGAVVVYDADYNW